MAIKLVLPILLLIFASTTTINIPTTTKIATGAVSNVGDGFDFIVVIVMENQGINGTYGSQCGANCSYVTSLANTYGIELNYSSVAHPSLANYLTLTSGGNYSYQPFLGDCSPLSVACTLPVQNVVDRIESSGRTWRAYMEDYTGGGCSMTSTQSTYANDHNPFVYYQDIRNNTGRCRNIVWANPNSGSGYLSQPTQLFNDLNSTNPPNFIWLSPNLCNDGHETCTPLNNTVLQSNNYLKQVVPRILDSITFLSVKNNAVLFITWDEGNIGCHVPGQTYPTCIDRVPAILAGKNISPGSRSNQKHSHYSFPATLEAFWNLRPLTRFDSNGNPMTELFITTPTVAGGRRLLEV
jgi:acid phosphatase